jgi:acetylornithine deacetylase/succinyl-diaminopimelate desuccinylase-like protein
MRVEPIALDGRTPVLLCVIEPTDPEASSNTLIYGHLDKQPPLGAWREGLHAFTPVLEGDRLYGRGAADDGYALFAALTAVEAVEESGGAHGRIVILIEASEESGSPDLDAHIDRLSDQIGLPDLIICLDSGCASYDRLWVTTSLRGLVTGTVRVEVMREGVHSGHAGGIVPSPSRIMRKLLDRIEDVDTGDVILSALGSEVPPQRRAEMAAVAVDLGEAGAGIFPLLEGVEPEGSTAVERIERGTWRPALAVIGQEGLPPIADAGNVALPDLALKLAVRIPPDVDAELAAAALRTALVADPPTGAHVSFEIEQAARGWNAPPLDPVIAAALESSSVARFGRKASALGLGGSIPFLGTLGTRFPRAQLLATGVLGPESNAHGPNEFLHLPTARSLTCTIADLLRAAT